MGFGLSSITNAVKSAVNTVSEAAHKVEDGVKAVEEKVAGAVRSAVEGATGHDGFDGDNHPGPLAESKPKGGSGTTGSSSYA